MNIVGLTTCEVNDRIVNNQVNNISTKKTKSIKTIILSNIFTYFNILNVCLALSILICGIIFNNLWDSIKNCLFLGVVICNTTIIKC